MSDARRGPITRQRITAFTTLAIARVRPSSFLLSRLAASHAPDVNSVTLYGQLTTGGQAGHNSEGRRTVVCRPRLPPFGPPNICPPRSCSRVAPSSAMPGKQPLGARPRKGFRRASVRRSGRPRCDPPVPLQPYTWERFLSMVWSEGGSRMTTNARLTRRGPAPRRSDLVV